AVYAGVYGGGWAAGGGALDPAAAAPCYACAARSLGRGGGGAAAAPPLPAGAPPGPGRGGGGGAPAALAGPLPRGGPAARVGRGGWVRAGRARDRGGPGPWAEWTAGGVCAWRFALRRVAPWDGGPWQLVPVPAPSEPACPTCGLRQPVAADLAALLANGDASNGAGAGQGRSRRNKWTSAVCQADHNKQRPGPRQRHGPHFRLAREHRQACSRRQVPDAHRTVLRPTGGGAAVPAQRHRKHSALVPFQGGGAGARAPQAHR